MSDSATPWTVTCHTPLSMGFSRQEYWSGLLCPPRGDLPDPGMESRSPALQTDSLPLSHLIHSIKCVYVNPNLPVNPTHLSPRLVSILCSLHQGLYFCLANKIIYIQFFIWGISKLIQMQRD